MSDVINGLPIIYIYYLSSVKYSTLMWETFCDEIQGQITRIEPVSAEIFEAISAEAWNTITSSSTTTSITSTIFIEIQTKSKNEKIEMKIRFFCH